eukprot:scaffold194308_cov30-Tisochrysis_lutea.AAC.1
MSPCRLAEAAFRRIWNGHGMSHQMSIRWSARWPLPPPSPVKPAIPSLPAIPTAPTADRFPSVSSHVEPVVMLDPSIQSRHSPHPHNSQLAHPPPLNEEDPEDTPFFIQLAQQAEDKKDIKSEDVATFMKF